MQFQTRRFGTGAVFAACLCLVPIFLITEESPRAQTASGQSKPLSPEAQLKAIADATQRNEPIQIQGFPPPPPLTRGAASPTIGLEPNQKLDYQEYVRDLRSAFQYLELYWSQALPKEFGRAFTRTGPYQQYGDTGAPHAAVCAGQTLGPNNAAYCPDTDSIHWHGPFLVGVYQKYGDFAAVDIWAHEYSHAMQRRLGLLKTNRFTIQVELEADCFAGAWASWAEKVAKIIEPGDIDEALMIMLDSRDRVGLPWFDPNAHGTAQERIRSFTLGYDKGTPKACVAR